MFVFKRAPRRSLSDLESFLREVGDQPVVWLEREVKSWGEFSYAELEDLILSGRAADLIDWQSRYAKVVNEKFNPLWLAAIARASYNSTRGKITIDDSDPRVKDFLRQRAAELIRDLSDESRRAIANVILHGQAERLAPKEIARQIRPLIGLNQRQAQANVNYRQRVFNRLVEQGLSATVANQRADKAAIKYASKQHRQRAETIVHTELSRAYNQGAHDGVLSAVQAKLMNHCEMVWTTAGTNRVCGRCLSLKDTVVGRTNEQGVQLPPLHPRCRCTISYRELTSKPTGNPPAPKNPLTVPASNANVGSTTGALPALSTKNYRSFSSESEAIDYFAAVSASWLESLTPQETAAIVEYTGKGYSEINGLLRGKLKESWLDEDDLARLKTNAALIESALSKFELPDDIVVYRRVGLMMLSKFKAAPNGIFREKGFTSTSLVRGSFVGDLELEIFLNKGKGLGAWIETLSVNPGENEFLLNSSMEFKIIAITDDGERPLIKLEVLGRSLKGAEYMDKNSPARKPTAEDKEKLRRYLESHSDRFRWEPDDLEFLDENGNWINADKLPDKSNS